MLGALLNLYVGDRLGRIKTLYVYIYLCIPRHALIPRAGIGIIIGTILQAASVTYGMMIFARIFNGVFNGMLTSTVPTYQSECSRPERRGPDVMISATVNIL
jgi:MFS family permease